MTLNKRIKRNIKNNFSFYLISTVLTMLISAFMIAALSTGSTLTALIAGFVDSYKAEDARFTTYIPLEDKDIEQLEEKYGVTIELNASKDAELDDGTVIRFVKLMRKVDLSEIRDGHAPLAPNQALITQRYADNHGIGVGDTLTVGGTEYTITGFFTRADYIYMLKDMSDTYRDNDNFALMAVLNTQYGKIDGDETVFYSIRYNGHDDIAVRKAINDKFIISGYIQQTSNTRISYPLNEGEGVSGMGRKLSAVMFVIVIAIVIMVLGRMIKREQQLLGTFRALGISKGKIVAHYTLYALIPGIAGSLLGLALAVPMTHALSNFYIENDYEKMNYVFRYNVPAIVTACVLPSVLYALTAAFTALRLMRKTVIDMLNNTGKDGKAIHILRKARIKIPAKMRIRSIVGHPGRSFVTLLGVIVASVCLMLGLVMRDSMDHMTKEGFKTTIDYEYMYALSSIGKDDLPEWAADSEPVLRVYYEVEGSTQQLNVQGITDSDMFPQKDIDGNDVVLDKYYITSAAAVTFGLGKGDTIAFRSIADLEEHEAYITGVIEDDLRCYMYTSLDNACRLAGIDEGSYNIIVSRENLSPPEEDIVSTTIMTDHAAMLDDVMAPIMAIVYIVVVVGAVLCLFVMYLVINMIIGEARSSLSVMKVLGLSSKEISRRVLNVNGILVIIGFIVSIPLAFAVTRAGVADTIESYGMNLALVLRPLSAVLGFVIIWLSYQASLLIQKGKLAKIDMVEALKENRRNE